MLNNKLKIYQVLIAGLSLVAGIPLAFADIGSYPNNALHYSQEINGVNLINTNLVASGSPVTILGISIAQSGTQSETLITCGNHNLFKSYQNGSSFSLVQHTCFNTLYINKTGAGDKSFTEITYVPYAIASRSLYASSSFDVSSSITSGEILIVLSLFILIMFNILAIFRRYI